MNEIEFNQFLGKISAQSNEGEEFRFLVNQMIYFLEDGDMDDYFGTEGWRHRLGWD